MYLLAHIHIFGLIRCLRLSAALYCLLKSCQFITIMRTSGTQSLRNYLEDEPQQYHEANSFYSATSFVLALLTYTFYPSLKSIGWFLHYSSLITHKIPGTNLLSIY